MPFYDVNVLFQWKARFFRLINSVKHSHTENVERELCYAVENVQERKMDFVEPAYEINKFENMLRRAWKRGRTGQKHTSAVCMNRKNVRFAHAVEQYQQRYGTEMIYLTKDTLLLLFSCFTWK
ncbi:hypothetical protein M513_13632, partial [Trichuris suis]